MALAVLICRTILILPVLLLVLYLSGMLDGPILLARTIRYPVAHTRHMLTCPNCGVAVTLALACWGPTLLGAALLFGLHR